MINLAVVYDKHDSVVLSAINAAIKISISDKCLDVYQLSTYYVIDCRIILLVINIIILRFISIVFNSLSKETWLSRVGVEP